MTPSLSDRIDCCHTRCKGTCRNVESEMPKGTPALREFLFFQKPARDMRGRSRLIERALKVWCVQKAYASIGPNEMRHAREQHIFARYLASGETIWSMRSPTTAWQMLGCCLMGIVCLFYLEFVILLSGEQVRKTMYKNTY